MKQKHIITLGILLILVTLFRPVLYKPFTYEASNVKITVVYKNESTHLELLPYSSLSVIQDHITLGDDVDFSKLNLNQKIKDGDVITIPLISDTPCVSINTGSLEDLITLPGIGNAIGQRILDYREENGAFQSLESIMEVKGIKDRLFERMAQKICL